MDQGGEEGRHKGWGWWGETCDCNLKLQTFEYLVEEGGRAGQPGKEGQRQPSGGQTYLPVLLVNYF